MGLDLEIRYRSETKNQNADGLLSQAWSLQVSNWRRAMTKFLPQEDEGKCQGNRDTLT